MKFLIFSEFMQGMMREVWWRDLKYQIIKQYPQFITEVTSATDEANWLQRCCCYPIHCFVMFLTLDLYRSLYHQRQIKEAFFEIV